MKGTIYVITNKINNKRYIGITTRNLEQRWYEHKRKSVLMKNEFKLYPAMNKYGIENFIIEGIDTADSLNELNEKEIFYIKKYDTINSGYKILPGGINSKHTEESKNKIRQARLKLGSPFNVGKILYTDNSGSCYKYKIKKTDCPYDKSKIKTFSPQ